MCTDIKDALGSMLTINSQTYQAVIRLQSDLSSRLERTLVDEPFVVEDAMGRTVPVHLQFINSWDALHAVLELQFRGLHGSEKVTKGEYTLWDHGTGRGILLSQP